MNMKLVEPLRELLKDEVSALARELGMPPELDNRHPFPGPGLAIRIPGEITKEKLEHSCARSTPSISTRSESPASTTTSGRPLPSSCRCAPWALMGDIAAPTTRPARCAPITSTDGMTAENYFPFDHAFNWAASPAESSTRCAESIA